MLTLEYLKSIVFAAALLLVSIEGIAPLFAAENRQYVAFGDSITEGLRDTDTSNGVGYPAHLQNLLPPPDNIVRNAGDAGDRAQEGLEKIGDVIAMYPSATHFLIMFGTNDVIGNTTISNYRSNMRGIIRAVEQAGKVPLLARIPPNYSSTHESLPFGPPCDTQSASGSSISQRIDGFNRVIDSLVSEYRLEVAPGRPLIPPDNNGHFQSTGIDTEGKSPQFADCVHPNDLGYRAMAQLWFNALQKGPIRPNPSQPFIEIYAYKIDNEKVSASTEFQPDDHIAFYIGKNQRWTFEALLWVKTTSPNGDFRFLWRGPKGSDVRANVVAYQGNAIIKQANLLGLNTIWSVDYTRAVNLDPIYIKGVFSSRNASGRIRLEWAQLSADGRTSLYFPSYLEARRVQAGKLKIIGQKAPPPF